MDLSGYDGTYGESEHAGPPKQVKKMHAKALQQFNRLPHVDDDMRRFETTADLVFQAQIQLDLIEEGELEASPAERNQLQRFVRNWRGK